MEKMFPQPAPMPMPMPMPAPMPMPHPTIHATVVQPPPVIQKPVHNDIHLHASYQQTSIVYPKPAVVMPVAKPSNAGSILVLFVLLVIITRSYLRPC
ncbi:hypothetical protein B5M42_020040 [Paenibacillus athensensis]|uniref:Uncharacterized protein n=1 Tax=Paenibacillus athensensis TaxID=1967502 RepID=A0A4Y8Q132_9BACL|nr:hypothetical protein [Paenibacillus athensensis]MCD1261099.1 hypothetical protein [Paenibacillus athensensis]